MKYRIAALFVALLPAAALARTDYVPKGTCDGWPRAQIGKDAGLTVIMNRCPKIEHGRFSGEIGWMGVNRRVIDNRKPLLFGRGGSLKNN